MTNNANGQQREITLKLTLQSTEAYFSYIAYVCFIFYYERRSVLFKIHAANIESSIVFVGDGKLFLKISLMLVVCMLLLQL